MVGSLIKKLIKNATKTLTAVRIIAKVILVGAKLATSRLLAKAPRICPDWKKAPVIPVAFFISLSLLSCFKES